ncbi:hypothetical protein [Flavobacterium sp. LHD-85]|uniref:hypothetical protein n=1 Tax=Flavobacterium sp. LHD-85 TaxID=3071410 RepID=UPI0027E1E038|nr:hypothetical protein [Flavobacterium sp. LHD-85]MDQ6530163.1 hypothetical protein [Flavobacterium sp. LHD-85]
MSQTLIENVKLAINPKFQDWVLFENGSYIIFNNTDKIEDIRKEAIKIMSEYGPVHIGSPAGDFGVATLKKAEGWTVSGHYYGMYTYVHPSEINTAHSNESEIGLFGRSKRDLDGQNPIVVHINRKDIDVKLIAGFVGLKTMQLPFVWGTNNFNPKLILKEDSFEHRGGLWSKTECYENIEKIDIYLAYKTTNIEITKTNSKYTFVGNTNNDLELRKCLAFFHEKKCTLTQKALDFLNH